MRTSQKGIDLIKEFEGFRENAYRCPAGVMTIGYGHTADVFPGMHITRERAEELLREDLADAEADVSGMITANLTQNQFDALVSFTFNLGGANLYNSTLRRVINANPNNFTEIARQFRRWNRAGGVISRGLVRRRAAEANMYCEISHGNKTATKIL